MGLLLSCRTMSSSAAFVRGCSVFVLINEKRPHGIGMRLQLLREPRISSRGRGLHRPKAEPRRKQLTSGPMTQAQRRGKAHQRQADRQGIAFWLTGYFPPDTHTHTHTHTPTDREKGRKSQRERETEREAKMGDTQTHTHTDSHTAVAQKQTHTHTDSHTAVAQKQTPPGSR